MRNSAFDIIIYFLIGVFVAWYFIPQKTIKLPGVDTHEYSWLRDTILTRDTIYLQKIKTIPILVATKDTQTVQNAKIDYNLVTRYEQITDSLIKTNFSRLKYYKKITAEKDTIDLTLESVRDSIMDLEIRLAAREVLNKEYRTIVVPKNETESWWIKPVIGAGGVVLGYGLGKLK